MSDRSNRKPVLRQSLGFLALVLLAYLLLWPVSIDPRAWNAPRDRGYVGSYSANTELQEVREVALPDSVGPEDIAIDPNGRPVFGVLSGDILRLESDGSFTTLTTTGGRPLAWSLMIRWPLDCRCLSGLDALVACDRLRITCHRS